MFAVNVQVISIRQVNLEIMSQFIQTSSRFVVVYAVNISDVRNLFHLTLRDVLIGWDLLILCLVSNSVVIYVDMLSFRTFIIHPYLCSVCIYLVIYLEWSSPIQ